MLKDKFIPNELKWEHCPIELTKWCDVDGKEIDESKYDKLIIAGDSLEPKNVNEGDLIFVKKKRLSEYSNIELPKICLFHRGSKYDEMENNYSGYIVCDIFARVNILKDDVDKIINDILSSDQFQKYRNDVRYISDDFIKTKFCPMQRYPNISIYPHLNYNNNWILEWVNSRDFYGTVEHSFVINR